MHALPTLYHFDFTCLHSAMCCQMDKSSYWSCNQNINFKKSCDTDSVWQSDQNYFGVIGSGCEKRTVKKECNQPTFLTVRQYPPSSTNNKDLASHTHTIQTWQEFPISYIDSPWWLIVYFVYRHGVCSMYVSLCGWGKGDWCLCFLDYFIKCENHLNNHFTLSLI